MSLAYQKTKIILKFRRYTLGFGQPSKKKRIRKQL